MAMGFYEIQHLKMPLEPTHYSKKAVRCNEFLIREGWKNVGFQLFYISRQTLFRECNTRVEFSPFPTAIFLISVITRLIVGTPTDLIPMEQRTIPRN